MRMQHVRSFRILQAVFPILYAHQISTLSFCNKIIAPGRIAAMALQVAG